MPFWLCSFAKRQRLSSLQSQAQVDICAGSNKLAGLDWSTNDGVKGRRRERIEEGRTHLGRVMEKDSKSKAMMRTDISQNRPFV
ncbi:unnamed protein product [Calypogeia fissa]